MTNTVMPTPIAIPLPMEAPDELPFSVPELSGLVRRTVGPIVVGVSVDGEEVSGDMVVGNKEDGDEDDGDKDGVYEGLPVGN
mmetsp:Transcript_27725/g.38723  ORF Transcript_27725/g.38723 Transcript_27725/m.38723 type:complete len:82 (+) Transcript_27725:259-504(+)